MISKALMAWCVLCMRHHLWQTFQTSWNGIIGCVLICHSTLICSNTLVLRWVMNISSRSYGLRTTFQDHQKLQNACQILNLHSQPIDFWCILLPFLIACNIKTLIAFICLCLAFAILEAFLQLIWEMRSECYWSFQDQQTKKCVILCFTYEQISIVLMCFSNI